MSATTATTATTTTMDQIPSDTKPTSTTSTSTSPSTPMTRYNMYYTTSRTNVTLHSNTDGQGSKSSPAAFYAQSKFLTSRPQFYIHAGAESGPIVSSVSTPWMGKNMTIALGDGANNHSAPAGSAADGKSSMSVSDTASTITPESADPITVTRDKLPLSPGDYHFTHAGTGYEWVKDRAKCASTAYECVDQQGNVYARLLSGGAFNWSKAGELYVREQGGDKELVYLLLAGAIGIWTLEGLNSQSLFKAFS